MPCNAEVTWSAGWHSDAHVLRSPSSLAAALQQVAADKRSDPGHTAAFLHAVGVGGIAIHMQRAQARRQRSLERMSNSPCFKDEISSGPVPSPSEDGPPGETPMQPSDLMQSEHAHPPSQHAGALCDDATQSPQCMQPAQGHPPSLHATHSGAHEQLNYSISQQVSHPAGHVPSAELKPVIGRMQSEAGPQAANSCMRMGDMSALAPSLQEIGQPPASSSLLPAAAPQSSSAAAAAADLKLQSDHYPLLGKGLSPNECHHVSKPDPSDSNQHMQGAQHGSFVLVKLKPCGKGRIHPGAAVQSTQHISLHPAGTSVDASPPWDPLAEPSLSEVQPVTGNATQTSRDPFEITLNDEPSEGLPTEDDLNDGLFRTPPAPHSLNASAAVSKRGMMQPESISGQYAASALLHEAEDGAEQCLEDDCQDGDVRIDMPQAFDIDHGDGLGASVESSYLQTPQDGTMPATHPARVLGYVTSCAPSGVSSHSAMALCSLEGLFSAWCDQASAVIGSNPSRHTPLRLWASNVRGGALISCKAFIVANWPGKS